MSEEMIDRFVRELKEEIERIKNEMAIQLELDRIKKLVEEEVK